MRIVALRRAVRRAPARAIALLLSITWLTAATCESAGQEPLSQQERAVHLLSRTTYGVRAQDVDELLRMGADPWLDRQLDPQSIDDTAFETRLVDAAGKESDGARAFMIMRAPAPPAAGQKPPTPAQARARMQVEALRRAVVLINPVQRLVSTKLARAVHSDRQLEEVMTDFWFNHFNVYYNKGLVRAVTADYERDAIRPYVFGRFEDMLRATAQHPAMLIYLDNATSTAPDADGGGGLNENYARELLELHTLGVHGGYTQQDVIEVARAFTGWTVSTVRRSGTRVVAHAPAAAGIDFEFDPEMHDTGEKIVLGRTLPAGRGVEDGLDVLAMLAAHRSTAEHIATKLVRHFVADEPPAELVAEIATVFAETGGDLRAVTRALFTAEAFYDRPHFRAKTKRPFEFMVSTLRATGADIEQDRALYNQLRAFGHLPYSEAAPTGYPTEASDWMSAGAVLARINFAMDLAAGRVQGVKVEPERALADAVQAFHLASMSGGVAPTARVNASASVNASAASDSVGGADAAGTARFDALTAALVDRLLAGVPTDALRAALAQDLALHDAADTRALLTRAMGLALGSPDFQRY